jgi:Icc-related predicted phosphoesterase
MGLDSETAPRFIPSDIDILVTHCPPKGILDDGERWGCPILKELTDIAEPKIHLFGHCHETSGEKKKSGKTTFINVAKTVHSY